MTTCRYDRDLEQHLAPNGEPCTHDEYGDPTKHCTARTTCGQHIGTNELTCARCIGRTRNDLRRITDLAALMLPAAIAGGINSEAAVLAGPAADYATFVARRRIGQKWIEANIPERNQVRAMEALLEDDDERHPYSVLGRWDMMIREDYRHGSDQPVNVANAADYLGRQLGKIAQDENQDWPLLAREIRKCRRHLESVLATLDRPERGTPCPACVEAGDKAPRLIRRYGHWCTDEDCRKAEHYTDDSGDLWTCSNNTSHQWNHKDYSKWVEERHAAARRTVRA